MAKVIIIPTTWGRYTAAPISSRIKRKIAGYVCVSTDHKEQIRYEVQVDYYTNYIKGREDWEFVSVYTDEGISATFTTKRSSFNKMAADAMEGCIDLIVTNLVNRWGKIKKCSLYKKLVDFTNLRSSNLYGFVEFSDFQNHPIDNSIFSC